MSTLRALSAYFVDLYRQRALAEILVQRELKARYRGTALGFFWSFANPLMMMSIYVLVFSVTMRLPVPHYGAFVLTGILPWNAFVASILEGMNALVSNGNLIKKVSLPAEVFPLVAVLANFVHFFLSVPVLLLVMWFSGVQLTAWVCLLPFVAVVQFLFGLSLALFLSSFAVQFRDLTHIIPNIVMMWFYVTPIIYQSDMVPAKLRTYAFLNPMAGIIDAYRAVLMEGRPPSVRFLFSRGLASLLAVGASLWLFRRRRNLYPEMV